MGKKGLWIFLLLLLALGLKLSFYAPSFLYKHVLNRGIDSDLLRLSATPLSSRAAFDYYPEQINTGLQAWKRVHFGSFSFHIPSRNPSLVLSPIAREEDKRLVLGAEFLNPKGKNIFSFEIQESQAWQYNFRKHRLFSLPIFKDKILKFKNKKVWQDIFSLDLDQVPENIDQIVYNFFIIHLRKQIFPKNTDFFTYLPKQELGLIRLKNAQKEDMGYQDELIFAHHQKKIHSLAFSFRLNRKDATQFRKKVFHTIEFQQSMAESSHSSYDQYKSLTYNEKISQFGLFHLLSAWSHDLDNDGFLKEIIKFSERKGFGQISLKHLYDYAYKKYGTNFSTKEESIRETSPERLKRKILEEEKRDIEELERTPAQHTPDKFENNDERIEFYLDKGESQNLDYDSKNDGLVIE